MHDRHWLYWVFQQSYVLCLGTIPLWLFPRLKERRNPNGAPFVSHSELSSALNTENPSFSLGKFLLWWGSLDVHYNHITLWRRMLSFQCIALFITLSFIWVTFSRHQCHSNTADIGDRWMECNWGSFVFMSCSVCFMKGRKLIFYMLGSGHAESKRSFLHLLQTMHYFINGIPVSNF